MVLSPCLHGKSKPPFGFSVRLRRKLNQYKKIYKSIKTSSGITPNGWIFIYPEKINKPLAKNHSFLHTLIKYITAGETI
jgi:hypothetical protein